MHAEGLLCNPVVQEIVEFALREDLGHGDVTTEALVQPGQKAKARVVSRSEGILAGIPVAVMVLRRVGGEDVKVEPRLQDGARLHPGDVVLEASGQARHLLLAERVLLNFLMRLSGVATKTREFVEALEGTTCQVLCTRKTTPGLRVLEKYAVAVGGARNHRFGLYDGVLIKENHIALLGGDVKKAVKLARQRAPALCKVEVEVRTFEQAKRAVEAGADAILLDHMDEDDVARVLEICGFKARLEGSGDLDVRKARALAMLGVDFVSVGAMTKEATWLDFSMHLDPLDGG